MTWGRVLSSSAATAAVAGCVLLAVGMSHGERPVGSHHRPAAAVTHASVPATKSFAGDSPDLGTTVSGGSGPAGATTAPAAQATSAAAPALTSAGAPSVGTSSAASSAPPSSQPSSRATTTPHTAAKPAPSPTRAAVVAPVRPAATRGSSLPLHYSTGSATRVVTVTARSTHSTTATVQAWSKASGGGWKRYGSAIAAHIGSDGMSTHASESRSATPMGSFTLTQAFGRNSDPGTALPYFRTNPSDYWISDAGPKYNTHQRCGSCGYNDGVNERLYYVNPEYDYAVVIDYNTRNAPGGVKAGRGSAFFLHVTDGSATAGCVAIAKSRLVTLLRWLSPSAHPRILIGTG